MVKLLKRKYNDSMAMGLLVIFITILANFFLVKWSLVDRQNSFQEQRFAKLLRATDYLFTALEHSEISKGAQTKRNNAFISQQLSLARKELMSDELKTLRIKLTPRNSAE